MTTRFALPAILTVTLASCIAPIASDDDGGAGPGATGGSGAPATSGAGGGGNVGPGTAGAPGGGGVPGNGGSTATGGRGGTGGATPTGGTGGRAGAGGAGGTAAGGSDGGGWLTGYTATMFGNTSVGDCNGVANFTDATNISGATCTRQGVTLAPFAAGVANNSSYYGAPGDLSSIWMGPTCRCQPGDVETAGHCPRAPSCPMEGDCARCFEIRCDPNGTGMYSDGATRAGTRYCNAAQTAVIQVIDACPHNHPTNVWWCTGQRANHIDISCSAMRAIASQPAMVGSFGWLNVQVRPVDCSVGLGLKIP